MTTTYGADQVGQGAVIMELALAHAERTNTHVWTAVMLFVLNDPTGELVLDHRNLAEGPVVGCYRCEEGYSPELAAQPCAGDPE